MEKRILQVFGEPLSNGGQESFIINIYNKIDKTKIQFDFYTPFYCDNEKLKEKIINLGGKIYTDGGRFDQKGNKRDFIKNLKEFLKHNKYDIIHIHSGSIFSLAYGAKIARRSGAKKVIVHSHATGINNLNHKIIKKISKPIFLKYATDYYACSTIAAEWKFPKKIIKESKYKIIKNGIDIEKFKFNHKNRERYRKEINIQNDFVICNVGRLDDNKNQKFILDLIPDLIKMIGNIKLILIGDGNEKDKLLNLVKQMKIQNSVVFLGKRNDVSEILQASDLFLFPSFFEGLGMVAIEAQATGLPIIASKGVPKEANITNIYYSLDLKEPKKEWLNLINNIYNANIERHSYTDEVIKNGYYDKDVSEYLMKLYLEKG